jgi:hypothetical protein
MQKLGTVLPKNPQKTILGFCRVLSGKNHFDASAKGHFIEHFSLPYFSPKDTISDLTRGPIYIVSTRKIRMLKMHPKAILLKLLKIFFCDVRRSIASIILGSLIVAYGGIRYLTGTAISYATSLLTMPTPLWATIAFLALCFVCNYAVTVMSLPKLNLQDQSSNTTSVKYCECCPPNERQPLMRTGGTSKRNFYLCPKTNQTYSIPIENG